MSDREPITSEWCGHERLACPLCAWDTLSGEDAFRAHMDEAHPLPAPESVPEGEAAPTDDQAPATPEPAIEAVGITKPGDIGSQPVTSSDTAPEDPAEETHADG